MKKLIVWLLAAALLLGCACAEALDFSRMSDDEVMAVYDAAKQELAERGLIAGTERTLREGKYIIGKDIPAGDYTITCIGTAGESYGDAYGSLGGMMDMLDDESDTDWSSFYGSLGGMMGDYMDMTAEIIGDYGDVLRSYSMKTGDSFVITLEEGTALKISDGSCTIVSK